MQCFSGSEKIYLDSKWQKCWRLTARYVGYVTPVDGKDLYEINVKFYPKDISWSKGTYSTTAPDLTKANGYVTWFYENGSIKSKTFFIKGISDGKSFEFYRNGNVRVEKNYVNGKLDGERYFFFPQGDTSAIQHLIGDSLDGTSTKYHVNGMLEYRCNYVNGKKDGLYESFFDNGSRNCTGKMHDGKMVGEWYYYHVNGQIASHEKYREGKIIWAEIFDENGIKENLPDSLELLSTAITYIGGDKKLQKDLEDLIIYPKEAIKKMVDGKVEITLELNNKGEVVKVEQTGERLGYGFDEEALRAARLLDTWNWGYHHNRKTNSKITIPIHFIPRK